MSEQLYEMLSGGGEPAPEEAAPAEGGGDTTSILEQMIQLAKQYLEVEEDPEDQETMSKLLSTLMKYKADEQREKDGLLQGKFTPRAMRRAS